MSKQPGRSNKQRSSYTRRKPVQLVPKSAPSPVEASPPGQQQRAEQLIRLGIDALQAHRFDDAEGYLQHAVSIEPNNPLLHNCLGITHRSRGRLAQAIESYQTAVRCKADYFEAYNNLGVAYEASGDNRAAIDSYREALRFSPDFVAACNNLGNALTKEGILDEAVASFDRALQLQPNFVAAHNNRGLALSELGRLADAEASFREALRYQPGFAEAYLNLGNVFARQQRVESAAECFRLAINSAPNFAPAHCCLGNTLVDQRRPEDALKSYETALQIKPDYAEASFGAGNAHKELGDIEASVASFREAIRCRPTYAEAYNNLGNVLGVQGDIAEAAACFEKAVAIKPDYLVAHNNLGNLYRLQDRLDEARECYRQIISRQPPTPIQKLRLSTLCPTAFESTTAMSDYRSAVESEWTSLRDACQFEDLSEVMAVANEPPFNLQFFDHNLREIKETYANIFRPTEGRALPTRNTDRIRIGCVVTANHEIAFLRLIWDALRRMNRDEFDLTILCMTNAVRKFESAVDGRADVLPLPDRPNEVISRVRAGNFDVLYYFEIGTDTVNYFLPFFRLAPVQCTSWGIQVTSGIPNVDCYLSSELVEPVDAQDHYSERLVLGKTLLAYQVPVRLPEDAKTRSWFGFTENQHLYMCIQHLGKFHPDFDALLAGILRNDPDGYIVLTEDRYGYGAKLLRARFQRTMPDVAERVVFLGRQAFSDYLSLLACGDVMLDAPHFAGVNTTYDGLSLDQPIVTMPSNFHRGRYTYACYQRMELNECVASNAEEYVEIATKLGRDTAHREAVRSQIREHRGLLFEDSESVTEHERIFRELVAEARTA